MSIAITSVIPIQPFLQASTPITRVDLDDQLVILAADPEHREPQTFLGQRGKSVNEAPILPVVRQRDPERRLRVVHALDQLAEHAEEVVDLLRPTLADLGLGLDDVAAAVEVPDITRGGVGSEDCCAGLSGSALTIFPVRPGEPSDAALGLEAARRLVYRLPVPNPNPLRQHVIVQRRPSQMTMASRG